MRTISTANKYSKTFDQDGPYKQVLAHYYNLVLGMGEESNKYWKTEMKILLMLKYCMVSSKDTDFGSVLDIENSSDYHLREQIGSKV